MPGKKKQVDSARLDQAVMQARRDHEHRVRGFRELALKLLPWICARCGREFSRHNLRELTVHHKDHDHDNNPSDGRNWELLCLYCHDMEHASSVGADGDNQSLRPSSDDAVTTYKPFAGLDALLKREE